MKKNLSLIALMPAVAIGLSACGDKDTEPAMSPSMMSPTAMASASSMQKSLGMDGSR